MHFPKLHVSLTLHALQVAPAEPHACVVRPDWHWPVVSQHPVQLDGPHGGADVGQPDKTKAQATATKDERRITRSTATTEDDRKPGRRMPRPLTDFDASTCAGFA